MQLDQSTNNDSLEIKVSGSVDEVGAEELSNCFEGIDPQKTKHIRLDFRNIDYIGSAGVGTLLLLYKKMAPHDGDIQIINIPTQLYNLLAKDMNLGQVIKLSSI